MRGGPRSRRLNGTALIPRSEATKQTSFEAAIPAVISTGTVSGKTCASATCEVNAGRVEAAHSRCRVVFGQICNYLFRSVYLTGVKSLCAYLPLREVSQMPTLLSALASVGPVFQRHLRLTMFSRFTAYCTVRRRHSLTHSYLHH